MPAGDMIDAILGRRRTKRKRGFTLLELLGVVALIGALTAGGIVAMRPREQFRTVWDARRVKDIANLEHALQQYAFADPLGRYPNNESIPASEAAAVAICKQGVENGIENCVNLDALVGRFITAIPFDSVEPCDDLTGYEVYRKLNERFPGVRATHMHKLSGDSVTRNCALPPSAPGPFIGYDFDAPDVPTEPGYISVAPTNIYTPARGYGWSRNLSPKGNNLPTNNSLLRDMHYTSKVSTFSADMSNGDYSVTLLIGDGQPRQHDRIIVTLEGMLQAGELAVAGGEFTAETYAVTVADGQLNLTLADNGGTDPNWVINGLVILHATDVGSIAMATKPVLQADGMTIDTYTGKTAGLPDGSLITMTTTMGTILSDDSSLYKGYQVTVTNNAFSVLIRRPSGIGATGKGIITAREVEGKAFGSLQQRYAVPSTRRFDFNRTTSPSETGFLGVRGTDTYTSTLGFGWTSGPIQILEKDTVVPTSLRRDMHYQSNPQTFHIQVKPGVAYNIRTYMGDTQTYHDYMDVVGEGQALFTVTSLPAGTFDVHTFTLTSADDDMQITFSQTGGIDPSWIINGIDISEETLPAEMP